MKTRVIRKGSLYYPQYKGWLFWKHFGKCVEVPLVGTEFVHAYFISCEVAREYIRLFEEDIAYVVWESN